MAHWLRGPCAWLASAVPLLLTLSWLAPTSQWRNDLGLVRGLGFIPIGGEGLISAVLAQGASLLPVGGRVLRAAIPGALASAVAGQLIYGFTLRVLDKNSPAPRLSPLLALVTAWAVVLGPRWQSEATLAGGAVPAVTLVLAATAVRFRYRLDERCWFGFGCLMGLAALEQRLAGLACLALLGVDAALMRQLPSGRQLLLLFGAVAGVATFGLLPFWFQPQSGGIWTDWGRELARLSSTETALPVAGTLAAWFEAVGLVVAVAALGGALWGISRPRIRPWFLPLLTFPLLDVVLPAAPDSPLTNPSVVVIDLLALTVLMVTAALGAHLLSLVLDRGRIPFGKPAQALLVVFSLTLVLARLEESQAQADAQLSGAAEAWTDEALASLPPQSLLMVRSEPAAWRLWASRVARGERPDVTVVPLPLLNRGDTAARLLALEPHLAPLVRELRVSGRPSEYALSALADARPLFLEFDPRWDRRLLDHVLPHPFWMRFSPHALGRSDRNAVLREGRDAFTRVLHVAQQPEPDRATLRMLSTRAREQVVMLAALGDRKSALSLVDELSVLPSEQGFARSMSDQLKAKQRGVDWLALLQ